MQLTVYYIIKICISLNYADVNFTMNSLCNETVKRYISSVVINLSASAGNTMAAGFCAKVRGGVYEESWGTFSEACGNKVCLGRSTSELVLCASLLDAPNDTPGLETAPLKTYDRQFILLEIFFDSCDLRKSIRKELNTFLRLLLQCSN